MAVTSADDPRVASLISGDHEYDIAAFLAHTLAAAVRCYNARG
jgi:hypothetical protein